jgi:hypothetical protein
MLWPAEEKPDSWVEPQVVAIGAPASQPVLAALRDSDTALLLGAAGTGKSTILERWAGEAGRSVVSGAAEPAVMLVSAAHLSKELCADPADDLAGAVARCVGLWSGRSHDAAAVAAALRDGTARLVVDALDELLSTADREGLAERIVEAAASGAVARFVISSRVVGLPRVLRTVPTLRLLPLSAAQLDELIYKRALHDRALVPAEIARLTSLSAGSPLLAVILTDVLLHQGRVSITRSALYTSIVDTSLELGIDESHPRPGAGDMASARRALHAIALGAFRAQEQAFTPEQARRWTADAVDDARAGDVVRLLMERLPGVLVSLSPETLSFDHLTVWHALVAAAIADSPLAARDVLDRPHSAEVLALAAGLAADPETILRLILQRSGTETLQAAWPEITARGSGIVRRAIDIVMSELSPIVGFELATTTPVHDPERRVETVRQWEALNSQQPEVKGRAFEEFAVAFFGEALTVVRHDLRSAVGQIDLVVANERPDPFWATYGTDFWVECKYEKAPASIPAINTFIGKLEASNRKLGFFVAKSRFTTPALKRIEVQAYNQLGPLIVPIAGAQIAAMLDKGEPVDSFVKARVRDVADLRPL